MTTPGPKVNNWSQPDRSTVYQILYDNAQATGVWVHEIMGWPRTYDPRGHGHPPSSEGLVRNVRETCIKEIKKTTNLTVPEIAILFNISPRQVFREG